MNNPSFIDNLADIQSRVRDGEKWEYQAWNAGRWESGSDGVDGLNLMVSHGYQVRLVPQPPKTTKEERIRAIAVKYSDLGIPSHTAYMHDRYVAAIREALETIPCTCAVEEER